MNANEAQRYARVAGVLIAISLLAGGFGESFVPGKLIAAGDFHETSLRVAASLGLFRAGFVAYLIEAACDLFLTAIFYLMLRPVSRPLSLITAFLGVFCTATFAVGEIFYYVAALPQIDAHFAASLSADDRTRFAYICLKIYGTVFNIFAGVLRRRDHAPWILVLPIQVSLACAWRPIAAWRRRIHHQEPPRCARSTIRFYVARAPYARGHARYCGLASAQRD